MAVVARLNRLATQRIQMPRHAAQSQTAGPPSEAGEARMATAPSITARNQR